MPANFDLPRYAHTERPERDSCAPTNAPALPLETIQEDRVVQFRRRHRRRKYMKPANASPTGTKISFSVSWKPRARPNTTRPSPSVPKKTSNTSVVKLIRHKRFHTRRSKRCRESGALCLCSLCYLMFNSVAQMAAMSPPQLIRPEPEKISC